MGALLEGKQWDELPTRTEVNGVVVTG